MPPRRRSPPPGGDGTAPHPPRSRSAGLPQPPSEKRRRFRGLRPRRPRGRGSRCRSPPGAAPPASAGPGRRCGGRTIEPPPRGREGECAATCGRPGRCRGRARRSPTGCRRSPGAAGSRYRQRPWSAHGASGAVERPRCSSLATAAWGGRIRGPPMRSPHAWSPRRPPGRP